MLVRRAVMRDMGGYFYQMGRVVLRLVPREVMQGMAGYVRQVGKGVLTLVRCAVTQYVGGYPYQMGRGVVRLVPGEVMQGMAGYARQVGTSVLTLVRCAVTQYVGGYPYQMGRGVLGLVRRAVAFLQFEDGWDAAGYICLSFGLALMLLGTLAAPDLPALYLLADVPQPIPDPTPVSGSLCPANADQVCDTGCKRRGQGLCSDASGGCGQNDPTKPQDCAYCGCTSRPGANAAPWCMCQ